MKKNFIKTTFSAPVLLNPLLDFLLGTSTEDKPQVFIKLYKSIKIRVSFKQNYTFVGKFKLSRFFEMLNDFDKVLTFYPLKV